MLSLSKEEENWKKKTLFPGEGINFAYAYLELRPVFMLHVNESPNSQDRNVVEVL